MFKVEDIVQLPKIDFQRYQSVSDDSSVEWLEKAHNSRAGKVSLEDIKDALDEFIKLFKVGLASKAEISTLARAFPNSLKYTEAARKQSEENDSDPIVIGGPASVSLVDREGHLITTGALERAFTNFMKNIRTRNAMVLHSDVQVGWALPAYISKGGQIFKSGVDEKGLYFICELRDDTAISKKVAEQISKGTLKSYSIAGSATAVTNMTKGLTPYMQVDDMELAEVTVCEKGVNQGATFELLKAELPQTGKVDKDQCGYRDATAPEMKVGISCGHCKYFNADTRTCDVVVGDIMPGDYCRLFAACEEVEKPQTTRARIVIMHSKNDGTIDFHNSFMDWMQKEKDPLTSGESFATLHNEAGRRAEHEQLLREYGFPSEQSFEAMRYVPVVETETDDDGIPIHNLPPWVVNEAGEALGDRLDEDAPDYNKSDKAKARQKAGSAQKMFLEILRKATATENIEKKEYKSPQQSQSKRRQYKGQRKEARTEGRRAADFDPAEAAAQRATPIGDPTQIQIPTKENLGEEEVEKARAGGLPRSLQGQNIKPRTGPTNPVTPEQSARSERNRTGGPGGLPALGWDVETASRPRGNRTVIENPKPGEMVGTRAGANIKFSSDVEKDFPGTKGPKKGGGPSRTDKGGVKKQPLYGNPNPLPPQPKQKQAALDKDAGTRKQDLPGSPRRTNPPKPYGNPNPQPKQKEAAVDMDKGIGDWWKGGGPDASDSARRRSPQQRMQRMFQGAGRGAGRVAGKAKEEAQKRGGQAYRGAKVAGAEIAQQGKEAYQGARGGSKGVRYDTQDGKRVRGGGWRGIGHKIGRGGREGVSGFREGVESFDPKAGKGEGKFTDRGYRGRGRGETQSIARRVGQAFGRGGRRAAQAGAGAARGFVDTEQGGQGTFGRGGYRAGQDTRRGLAGAGRGIRGFGRGMLPGQFGRNEREEAGTDPSGMGRGGQAAGEGVRGAMGFGTRGAKAGTGAAARFIGEYAPKVGAKARREGAARQQAQQSVDSAHANMGIGEGRVFSHPKFHGGSHADNRQRVIESMSMRRPKTVGEHLGNMQHLLNHNETGEKIMHMNVNLPQGVNHDTIMDNHNFVSMMHPDSGNAQYAGAGKFAGNSGLGGHLNHIMEHYRDPSNIPPAAGGQQADLGSKPINAPQPGGGSTPPPFQGPTPGQEAGTPPPGGYGPTQVTKPGYLNPRTVDPMHMSLDKLLHKAFGLKPSRYSKDWGMRSRVYR